MAKIRPEIQKVSFDFYEQLFAKLPGGEQKLPDQEVKVRLATMVKNFGKDERTHALAILNSGLDPAMLIQELTKIRGLMLHRLSDEAVSDVKMTDAMLNDIRFKSK